MGGKALDSDLKLPTVLFGYDVVEYLGQGAGSDIYAVSDPKTHQIYALKHVVRKHDKSDRFFEQLHTEHVVASAVSHANVRRTLDLKVNKTLLRKNIDAALIMELFDGTSLETRPTSSIDTTLRAFIQTAKGLNAIHAAGFVHCDLKPNNILRNDREKVKVIDLGQACPIGTVKERVQGTPDYMAPEQVKCEPVSVRTDIFNFGATLYWALTGKHIPTLFQIKKSRNSFLLDSSIATPRELNPDVADPLSNLVMECVRSSPEKRPESMSELIRRLEIMRYVHQRAMHLAEPAIDPTLLHSVEEQAGSADTTAFGALA